MGPWWVSQALPTPDRYTADPRSPSYQKRAGNTMNHKKGISSRTRSHPAFRGGSSERPEKYARPTRRPSFRRGMTLLKTSGRTGQKVRMTLRSRPSRMPESTILVKRSPRTATTLSFLTILPGDERAALEAPQALTHDAAIKILGEGFPGGRELPRGQNPEPCLAGGSRAGYSDVCIQAVGATAFCSELAMLDYIFTNARASCGSPSTREAAHLPVALQHPFGQ